MTPEPVSTSSFWKDRRVFVTGATGLLGSHLCEALVQRGADVVVLIRDQIKKSHFYRLGLEDRVVIVRGSLEDHALLERTLVEYEVDTVFHLGAQTIVGIANTSPMSTWESNVRGTYNLLEACRRNMARVRRVVVASSDKAYGASVVLPYEEGTALEGRFAYDCSKSCTDLIATSYHRTFGLPVAITRCGNLFGPGDLNWNRLVPGTIRSALRGESPVIRSDGSFVRDYLPVSDAVSAYLDLALAIERPEVVGEAFNFSLDQPLSVTDMARRVLTACGSSLDIVHRHEASHEIQEQYISSEKAHRLLGWRPRLGLDEGLALTVAWYREFLGA